MPGGINNGNRDNSSVESGGQADGIVQWASMVYTPKADSSQKAKQNASGIPGGRSAPAPDGYQRKTPVQEIRIPEGYRKRMVTRAVAIIIGAAVVAAVVYVVLTFIVRL